MSQGFHSSTRTVTLLAGRWGLQSICDGVFYEELPGENARVFDTSDSIVSKAKVAVTANTISSTHPILYSLLVTEVGEGDVVAVSSIILFANIYRPYN